MISSLKFIVFQNRDSVECHSFIFQSRESFLPITYEFKPRNVYGLISDFGCGSWGLTTCVGGRFSKQYSGKVLLNETEIAADELEKYACFVSENIFTDLNLEQESLTARACIERALSISLQPYSVNQIKSLFCLSDNRFERPLAYVSGEIWLISMAINFALGKQIFCYPWLNERDIFRFEIAYEHGIIKLLKDTGKIVLVPSSQKKVLRKYCDHTILFAKGKMVYR